MEKDRIIMSDKEMLEYQLIYSNQCVYCLNEGTYHCELDINDGKCKNYKVTKE